MVSVRRISNYEAIPYGLSLRSHTQNNEWQLFFAIPLMVVYRRHVYNIYLDEFQDGWHTLRLCLRFGKGLSSSFDFMVAWGWILQGV